MIEPVTGLNAEGALGESRSERWRRRRLTIPAMLGATALVVLLSPVIVLGAVLYDLLRLRLRLPTLRLVLFVAQYMLNDSAEILLCGPYWLIAGFGRHLYSASSIRRHERLQQWSIDVMARRAARLLGLRVEIDDEGAAALDHSGPVIVLCRHVNVVDSSLPALLYQTRRYRVRGVLMAELLADPGFDLLYGRLGSVFVPRESGSQARAAVARLRAGNDRQLAVVIFPEGRVFRVELKRLYLDKLAQRDVVRSQRLGGLRHVLPPRPGGVNALLDVNPNVDVVVIAHAGLDPFPTFLELARNAPLQEPIRVTAWRFPRSRIPESGDDRVAWLDEIWCWLDDWVDRQLAQSRS